MKKPYINMLMFFDVLTVSSVYAVSEQFYFNIIEDPESIDCSDHVARVSTAPSAMKCCIDCSRNGQCQGVMYDPVTMDCKEVHKTVALEGKGCQTDIGAAYYSPEGCDIYLVSGTHGVEDDRLNASSTWCDTQRHQAICQPGRAGIGLAAYARLNRTGLFTGGWIAGYKNEHQYIQVPVSMYTSRCEIYLRRRRSTQHHWNVFSDGWVSGYMIKNQHPLIQVDFQKATTVTQVVMQARDPVWNPYYQRPINQYVTRFKVQYSQDCSTYEELKQENDNTLIFEGNSSSNDTVIRALPRRVTARCFRINPVQWFTSVTMRFDLLGCL